MRIHAKNLKPGDTNAHNGETLRQVTPLGDTGDIHLVWDVGDDDNERRHSVDAYDTFTIR